MLQPVTILSAELAHLDYYSNKERTDKLRNELLNNGYSFTGVKFNGKNGFLVPGSKSKKLIKLAQNFEQNEIYFSDKERQTQIISCLDSKSKDNLGKLFPVSKDLTIKSSKKLVVSFYEDGKEHFFTTEE